MSGWAFASGPEGYDTALPMKSGANSLNLRSGIVLVLCLSGGAATANSARVIDGDTLDLDGQRHRLFGIDAAERNQRCRDEQGLEWACAAAASAALKRLLSMGSVSCAEVPGTRDGFGRQISRCKVNGEDVAETLVRDGLVWAFRRYSTDYVDAELEARAARRGVWAVAAGGTANQPPWAWRAERRAGQVTSQNAADPDAGSPDAGAPENTDCRIKGNISGNGRIYHVPGSRDWAATRINVQRGERWFCSEQEAQSAGWRRARGQ